jgi:UDPglucose 6-dehydrogenase
MRIAMIGGGYVGLVSAACFADLGVEVCVVEREPVKLATLRQGAIPIYEPGLDQLVTNNVAAGRLRFTDDLAGAVAGVAAVFIAVGTPTRRGDGHADVSYVNAAAEQVARAMTGYAVIVTKSTVPVGTGRGIAEIVRLARPDLEFDVASNPEFLREGSALGDFMRPDRVVIGTDSARAREVLRQLYRPLYLIETPILFTSIETAELTKYAANAFLAMKVTFVNEMADLCERVGADVHDIARGIGLDGRIGRKFLHPGPGYGGSCFPKDTLALARIAQDYGAPSRLVETTAAVNDARKAGMAARVIAACGGTVRGRTITVLGLTFKPETDDMRDAPSLSIIPRLVEAGATIRAFDPAGMEQARPLLPDGVVLCRDAPTALDHADALVVVTEWNEFRALSPERLAAVLRQRVVVDLRNVFDPAAMRAAGLRYCAIGRPDVAGTADREGAGGQMANVWTEPSLAD